VRYQRAFDKKKLVGLVYTAYYRRSQLNSWHEKKFTCKLNSAEIRSIKPNKNYRIKIGLAIPHYWRITFLDTAWFYSANLWRIKLNKVGNSRWVSRWIWIISWGNAHLLNDSRNFKHFQNFVAWCHIWNSTYNSPTKSLPSCHCNASLPVATWI